MKPKTLSSHAWRHFASSSVSIVPPGMSRALFTRMSTSPQSWARFFKAAPSRRSTEWVLTSPPNVLAACARRSLSLAAMCTRQPSATKALAKARPMPFDAPVTRTDLPFRRRSMFVSYKEEFDGGLYHRNGQHKRPAEIPGICETGGSGQRQARQPVPGARRQEAHDGGRHPLRAHRGERIPGCRDGEEVLQLAGVPGRAQASPGRRRLPHGDRGRRFLEPVGRGQALALEERAVEELRLVARPGVGEDRHHGMAGPQIAREADGAGDVDAARAAEHQAFLLR